MECIGLIEKQPDGCQSEVSAAAVPSRSCRYFVYEMDLDEILRTTKVI